MTIDITAHNADGMVHFWLGKTTESLLDFQPWMIW
jgi:FAD/FMN-containing dehydrogenase